MIVNGEKTKLLISGTYVNRFIKVESDSQLNPAIKVDGNTQS